MEKPAGETFPSYEAARDWLFSLKNRGSKYGIDRMLIFAEALGQPQLSFPTIHVAGTNGKGSTCAMLERILRGAGWRVGLSTSPHIVRQGERVQVDREILHEEQIRRYANRLRPVAEQVAREDAELHPSFFEFMTAMAFLHFQQSEVDVAVVEVGLGGRLDATNILQPELCVITSIGLDHCEILGDSVAKIAREKAGIIKPGVPVVAGLLCDEAMQVVREVCAERGCQLHTVAERFGEDWAAYPETNLGGSYQRINAGIASLAAELLAERFRLASEKTAAVLQSVNWPGRWEERDLPGGRRIVFDVTHNEEGARWLDKNLQALVARCGGRRPDVVMGVMGDYRARSLVPVAARWARELIFVMPQQDRACTADELKAHVPADFSGPVRASSIAELFPQRGVCSLDEADAHPLVVSGSLYLVGEIWERFYEESPLGQGSLQDF